MSDLKGLFADLFQFPLFDDLLKKFQKKSHQIVLGLGNDNIKSLAATRLAEGLGVVDLVMITSDMTSLKIWETNFSLSSRAEIFTPSLTNLKDFYDFWQLLENNKKQKIILLNTDTALMAVPSLAELKQQQVNIAVGDSLTQLELFDSLQAIGYEVAQDERAMARGEFYGRGSNIELVLAQSAKHIKIEFFADEVTNIYELGGNKELKNLTQVKFYPLVLPQMSGFIWDFLKRNTLVLTDEIGIVDNVQETDSLVQSLQKFAAETASYYLQITVFPAEDVQFTHEKYISLMSFYSDADLFNYLIESLNTAMHTVIFSKKTVDLINKLEFEEINFYHLDDLDSWQAAKRGILIVDARSWEHLPHSFQNLEHKIAVITDREIFHTQGASLQIKTVVEEFIGSLKNGNFVVHTTHGIGIFIGMVTRTIGGIIREYLHLQYAGGDALYVPIDQADKVNKFIGGDSPHLTRLDSGEWKSMNTKAQKEASRMAGELLAIYAKRKLNKTESLPEIPEIQEKFDATFPYDETPGQLTAIADMKQDLQDTDPMDRLICGDVGFGKTEVAMRAAFQVFTNARQTAVIAPITILAEQHYQSFTKRMAVFGVRIAVISRFKTQKEQKVILQKLAAGEIDIIIGTHRLLSVDVKFANLGLLIVDEEQRFGVGQKEKIKKLRANVNILTLSATPIPRTLNLAMSKLRDMSLISTPPVGRLPIITEVRKFSLNLIKEVIERELARGGQVYFLHNKVQTIESVADKIKRILPQAKVVVAHGQMSNDDLEQRIISFKNGTNNVLISSTIIENGIDLPNANTLLVNGADEFGLAQLYQLRGRVGRAKKQAFCYLLYQKQRLTLDAKKRLRAIIEASELGSGFQIAMKDLEIRGAGDILGVNQSGAINTVGVGHFLKILNQAVADLRAGRKFEQVEEQIVLIDLPISAYIPDEYIDLAQEKIRLYQKMAQATEFTELKELQLGVDDRYGSLPEPVRNLFVVLFLKLVASRSGIIAIKLVNLANNRRQVAVMLNEQANMMALVSLVHTNPKWELAADRIKIDFADLGMDWVNSLKKQLITLLNSEDMLEAKKYL